MSCNILQSAAKYRHASLPPVCNTALLPLDGSVDLKSQFFDFRCFNHCLVQFLFRPSDGS